MLDSLLHAINNSGLQLEPGVLERGVVYEPRNPFWQVNAFKYLKRNWLKFMQKLVDDEAVSKDFLKQEIASVDFEIVDDHKLIIVLVVHPDNFKWDQDCYLKVRLEVVEEQLVFYDAGFVCDNVLTRLYHMSQQT